MRIACIDIPRFYVQVAMAECPGLRGRPVIIGVPGERCPVADCSEEAAARGVTEAITVEEAVRRCPDAVVLFPQEGRYEEVWEEILAALASFTLRIEAVRPGTAFLDITRALRVWKREEPMAAGMAGVVSAMFRLKARVGIGNSRFIAREAARTAHPRGSIVPPGGERRFAAFLSIECLPVPEEVKERLDLLGLRTLGKIGALSRGQLISQFGGTGETIWRLVQGLDDREGIEPRCGVSSVERETVCEPPLETTGHLVAPLRTTIAALTAELDGLGRRCRKVRLMLRLQGGEGLVRDFVLHRPTASADEIERRVYGAVESVAFGSPIIGIVLTASALSGREEGQGDLFRGLSRGPQCFGAVRGFLTAKYGRMPVVRIEKGQENSSLPEKRFLFTAL